MANTTTTPNMNLAVPVVGAQTGPQYATDLNNCFTVIDQHDHSPGKGVQISSTGINISADFVMNNYNLTAVRSLRLQAQPAVLGLSSDLDCFYVTGVDAYFNDGNGNQIRLTQSGGIAGTPGSIAGLTSPAAATYVSANQTFVWQSDSNIAANLDAGSVIFRNLTASSNGVTVSAPNSVASNYSIVWPTLPVSQKFLTLDASGNMSAPWAVDNSTIEIASSTTVQVKDSGIVTAKLNDLSVTTAKIDNLAVTAGKIAAGAVTQVKMGSLGQQVSSSSGAFNTTSASYVDVTNLTVTITTTGRPVMIMFQPDGTANLSRVFVTNASLSTNTQVGLWKIVRGASDISICYWGGPLTDDGTSVQVRGTPALPAGSFNFFDAPAAGTYTYKVQVLNQNTTRLYVEYVKMVAYEL